jgi:nucleotide-binding universal stress UspA family protein
MQSILVAVDGSPHSLEGVREAARLAKGLGHKLELVNVLPPILLSPAVYAETIAKLEQGNREVAQEHLDKAKKLAAAEGVTDVETIILTGPPAEAIADLSQEARVWGVVIGAKGHGAVKRVLLGSVTDRLVHICNKPVLVVR